MATQRQLRRGTAAEIAEMTPAEGELVYATDTKEVTVGDGETAGGNSPFALPDELRATTSLTLPSTATTGIEVFNTSDEDTNYEKFGAYWSGNIFTLGNISDGTGSGRGIRIGASPGGGVAPSRLFTIAPSSFPIFKFTCSASGTGPFMDTSGLNTTASSGSAILSSVNPVIAQSGTAGYTALEVNPTESSTGSGSKTLQSWAVGGSVKASMNNAGTLNLQALTASRITATDSSKNVVSLSTATYPSLTELACLKGATSAVQTQLDAKAPVNGTHGFSARSSGSTITSATLTKIAFDTEDFDPAGEYDSATNYRYTPQKAGKYYVTAQIDVTITNVPRLVAVAIFKNGSRFKQGSAPNSGSGNSAQVAALIDMNGSTDYLEIFGYTSDTVDNPIASNSYASHFSAFLTTV